MTLVHHPLRQHNVHGTFQLDMTQAHGTGLPPLGTTEVGVANQGSLSMDREMSSPVHAFLMCLAFIVLFPLGVVLMRVFSSVKIHMYIQGAGLAIVTIASGLGIAISSNYQRVCVSR